MTVDLRPAPRLPLDLTTYRAIKEGNLDAFITDEPIGDGRNQFQISLLQTRTPNYWPSAHDRAVYDSRLVPPYPGNFSGAEAVARDVLRVFANTTPYPPQHPYPSVP